MKLLHSCVRPLSANRFVHLETCRAPDIAPEFSGDQAHARGQILEILVDEIQRSRPGYLDKANFVETDDPDTLGIYIQEEKSGRLDALVRDPGHANRASRLKNPGEIILDQTTGVGNYTEDLAVFSTLSPTLLEKSGFADKSELVDWVRNELSYATEVANTKLGAEEERRQITPGVSFRNIVTRQPAVAFAAEQTSTLTAQANMMMLPVELDALEASGSSNEAAESYIASIGQKLNQISEAGFDCSAYRARFERLQQYTE